MLTQLSRATRHPTGRQGCKDLFRPGLDTAAQGRLNAPFPSEDRPSNPWSHRGRPRGAGAGAHGVPAVAVERLVARLLPQAAHVGGRVGIASDEAGHKATRGSDACLNSRQPVVCTDPRHSPTHSMHIQAQEAAGAGQARSGWRPRPRTCISSSRRVRSKLRLVRTTVGLKTRVHSGGGRRQQAGEKKTHTTHADEPRRTQEHRRSPTTRR